jgi:hypothetical protein
MGFYDTQVYSTNKDAMLSEILNENEFRNKSMFEKSKIVLNNSTHTIENMVDWAFNDRTETVVDMDFKRDLANKTNLEIAKEYKVDINEVERLRATNNPQDFEDTKNLIWRQQADREAMGAISKDTGWAVAGTLGAVVGDPLLVPMLFIPALAPESLGMAGRAVISGVAEAGMTAGYTELMDKINYHHTELGDKVGYSLFAGAVGGVLGAGAVRELRRLETQTALQKFLPKPREVIEADEILDAPIGIPNMRTWVKHKPEIIDTVPI